MEEFNLMLVRQLHNLIGTGIIILVLEGIRWWLVIDAKVAIRKISKCNNADVANQLRRKTLKRRRWVLWSSLLINAALITLAVMYVNDEMYFSSFVALFIVCLIFLATVIQLFVNSLKSFDGNIDPISFCEFEKSQPYSVFLRGFISDEIERRADRVIRYPKSAFSELRYVKQVEVLSGHVVYAVGNPKELDSPYGARRIYLDDSSWKEDVLSLMDSAYEIHIRLCNTPSCIWELRQAFHMLDKLSIIVDDFTAYDSIRRELGDYFNLPDLDSDIGWSFYKLSHSQNSGWIVNRYITSRTGYQLINNSMDKGVPCREKRRGYEIVIPILLSVLLVSGAPDIASWGRGVHEVRLGFDRLNWEPNEWESVINKRLPMSLGDSLVLSACSFKDNGVVFYLNSFSSAPDSYMSQSLCGNVLELVLIEDGEKTAFYRKAFVNNVPIRFIYTNGGFIAGEVSLSEEDLIDIGILKRHVLGHRSVKEELDAYYENLPPPIVY